MPTPINITPEPQFRPISSTIYQGIFNGVVERVGSGTRVRPLPALQAVAVASGAGDAWGCYYWQKVNKLYQVYDYTVWYGTSGSLTSLGNTFNTLTASTVEGDIYWAENKISGGNTGLFIQSPGQNQLFYISSAADTTLAAVAGDPATQCAGVQSLDGYVFVMTPTGEIYNSTLNDGTAGYTDYVSAENEPDRSVFLGKYKNHLVALGTRSLEFFSNQGYPTGSPLAPRRELAQSVGCFINKAAPTAFRFYVDNVGDLLAWVGYSKTQGFGVYILDNFTAVKISNQSLDMKLESLFVDYNYTAGVKIVTIYGRTFVTVYSGESTCYLYDVENKFWTVGTSYWGANVRGFTHYYEAQSDLIAPYLVSQGNAFLWKVVNGQSYYRAATTADTTAYSSLDFKIRTEILPTQPQSNMVRVNQATLILDDQDNSVTSTTGTLQVLDRAAGSLQSARSFVMTNEELNIYRFGQFREPLRVELKFASTQETTAWSKLIVKDLELDVEVQQQ